MATTTTKQQKATQLSTRVEGGCGSGNGNKNARKMVMKREKVARATVTVAIKTSSIWAMRTAARLCIPGEFLGTKLVPFLKGTSFYLASPSATFRQRGGERSARWRNDWCGR
jgi:hypothetical protein